MILDEKLVVITGGSGLLGREFSREILDSGADLVNLDLIDSGIGHFIETDITHEYLVKFAKKQIESKYNRSPDVLINNAAINHSPEDPDDTHLESMTIEQWDNEINVGLKGAFICSRVFGQNMAEQKNGTILNIASDLGLIAPDQRIYGETVKPITYSVIKHGIIGLTRYLATYWGDKGVRSNALCLGGVYNEQPELFVKKLENLIPIGRMARKEEYNKLVSFMISDYSSYMNGSIVVADGGRTTW